MSLSSPSLRRTVPTFLAAAILVASVDVIAQPKSGRVRTGSARRQGKDTRNPPFHFGNITISNSTYIGGAIGKYYEAKGPDVIVDVVDPKDPASKTRLTANTIKAYFDESAKTSDVDRIEADRDVRFNSVRPVAGGGSQVLEGSGTKAVYSKKSGKAVLTGPVTYHGRMLDKAGAVLQSAKGTAATAEYDEVNQILVLSGGVDVEVTSPSLSVGTLKGASNITLELAKQPILFHAHGGQIHAEPKETEPSDKKKNP